MEKQSRHKENHMTEIQNTNIVFRCPASLKAKMQEHAEASGTTLSDFVRTSCVDALNQQRPSLFPSALTPDAIAVKIAGLRC